MAQMCPYRASKEGNCWKESPDVLALGNCSEECYLAKAKAMLGHTL